MNVRRAIFNQMNFISLRMIQSVFCEKLLNYISFTTRSGFNFLTQEKL
jgi:hypothetical protein